MIDLRLIDGANNEIRIQDGLDKVHILIRSPEFEDISFISLSIASSKILIQAIKESIKIIENNEKRDNINS